MRSWETAPETASSIPSDVARNAAKALRQVGSLIEWSNRADW